MLFDKQSTNSNKIIYRNARIIDPKTEFDKIGNLLTHGDKIVDFGTNTEDHEAEAFDCKGNILCPALIDMQVHFRDPGQTHKEDIITGSKSAVAGGIGTVVCQPNTIPTIDHSEIVDYIYNKAKQDSYCNILTYGSISKGLQGKELTDFSALKKAGVVGLTDDGLPVMNAHMMRQAFLEAKKHNLLLAQHAEDLNLTNKGCIGEGSVAQKLKVKGIPNISESVIVKRDLEILEDTGGQYHLLHVSTRQALNAIKEAKQKGLNATVEVAPHHFFFNNKAVLKYGTNAKMNPPLRSEEDRLALIEGLRTDVIDAIATDHAPHDLDSKNKNISEAAFGIIGLESLLPISLSLYHNRTLGLIQLLKKLTCNPAKILGIEAGVIQKGAKADLILLDLDHEWVLRKADLHSKSKNTPFDKINVKGKVLRTIISGKAVFINE